MIEEEKFSLKVLRRVISFALQKGKKEVTESQLKILLCGEKCPECGKISLGYIEADEHRSVCSGIRKNAISVDEVLKMIDEEIEAHSVDLRERTITRRMIGILGGRIFGMQVAKDVIRKAVGKQGKESREGTLVF